MKSYAQNFEDVLLWRALRDVSHGFYIDLGAQHPVLDSVSRWFYEQGWRGIHVEPLPFYADLLRRDRPDEEVVEAAVSEEPGDHLLYAFPDTGLSTMDVEIANTHKVSLGREWQEQIVPSVTLAELFLRNENREVHWLKVDVEGHERSALASWGDSSARPWVVLVEATYPNSQSETHHQWEHLLTSRGYAFVYADGLNRYYLHESHKDRRDRFRYPPNYFDHFSLSEHWATRDLQSAHVREQNEIGELLRQSEDARGWAEEEKAQALKQSAERDARFIAAFSEQLASATADLVANTARLHKELKEQSKQSEAKILDAQRIISVRYDVSLANLATEMHQARDVATSVEAGLERINVRMEEEGHRLQAQIECLRTDFTNLREEIRGLTASPGAMLMALLRSRKESLPVNGRMFSTARLRRRPEIFVESTNATPVQAKHIMDSHSQGPNRLTEDPILPAVSLADLYAMPPAEFIKISYQALLGRDADESGLAYYFSRMALGDSRRSIHRSIVRSKEHRARANHEDLLGLDDEELIEAAYRRILGRTSDTGGREYYLARLRDGTRRSRVLADLTHSAEARARFDPLLRLREQILASLSRRDWPFRFGQTARSLERLNFSLSTAIHRIDADLRQTIDTIRADVEKLGSARAAVALPVGSSARPRWVPREVRLARVAPGGHSRELTGDTSAHPDHLALTARMRQQAQYGELSNVRDGQRYIDDYLENAYDVENHGDEAVRWIGAEALAYLRVTGPRFNMQAAGIFEDRIVLVSFDDVVIGTLRFGKERAVAQLPVPEWPGRDVIVRLKCSGIFNPAATGTSSDKRDLGVLLSSIYFD
jgi:FkbM family methyltransferase